MGFTREEASNALKECFGDVDRAAEKLLKGSEEEKAPPTSEMDTTATPIGDGTADLDPAVLEEAMLGDEPKEKTEEEIAEELKQEREKELKRQVEDDILDSVEEDAEAHLDITLEEETALLTEYKLLLEAKQGVKKD